MSPEPEKTIELPLPNGLPLLPFSVSGKTEVTYSNTQNGNNGNPFGNGNSIVFSGSGDMNGMTAT
jgi:hypothetical protein